MAVVKRTVRRKVTKVWDLAGNEHVMPILNARDMVQHNHWSSSPPVIRYLEKVKSDGAQVQVVKQAETPESVDTEDDDETFEDVNEEDGDETELLNEPNADATDDVEVIDEVVEMVPNLNLSGGPKAPSDLDPTGWTKDEIVKYAQDKYATKLDGRKGQMTLVAELMKLAEALG